MTTSHKTSPWPDLARDIFIAENAPSQERAGSRFIEAFSDLRDFLHDLNYEHECGHTAFLAKGVLYSAFCTDPDGRWILETGDPRERMGYREDDVEQTYDTVPLEAVKESGPYTVLWAPGGAGAR